MKNGWDIVRHRVAIAGRVLDAGTGKPLGDAEVVIRMPEALKKTEAVVPKAVQRKIAAEKPDTTRTRPDGLFYFLDLPDGKYNLQASIPRYGSRYGQAEEPATVSRSASGDIKKTFVRCALQPTQVRGKVTGTDRETGIALARVRVKGSGELGFTDAQGQYTVARIEPGKRTLVVSAQGYRDKSQEFTLGKPGASQIIDVILTRENG
jgi:CarboxypepD_reg-like domain